MGERRPLFPSVPGKFISSAPAPRSGKWRSSFFPIPQPPRARGWQPRALRAQVRLGAARLSAEPAWAGEKFVGVAAATLCAGSEIAPGNVGHWASGPAGGWRGALLGWGKEDSGRWERVGRGWCHQSGQRVTSLRGGGSPP